MEETLTYPKKMYSLNTGGGIMVDIIVLEDGTTLSITDECVLVWEKEEDFYGTEMDDDGELRNYTAIYFDETPHLVHESRRQR